MDNAYTLLYIIVAFAAAGWLFQAARLWPDYKNGLYRELYGGFIFYFWHVVIRQDASESGYLRQKIGYSRILFSKIDKNGKTAARFCTIFYNEGLFTICYQNTDGAIHGKAKDKDWVVTRTDKKGQTASFRHHNPTADLEAYLRRLAIAFPDAHMETRICFPDKVDFSGLKSDVQLIHAEQIMNELQNVKADFISDEMIKADFAKASGEKA